MDFYYLPYNNFKALNSNKNNQINPNQLRNFNYNSELTTPISPIKTQNYEKLNINLEKDPFFNSKKNNDNNSNNIQFFGYKLYDNNILTNKNYKSISSDIDNKSANLNDNIRNRERNIHLLNNNQSYSILSDNKTTKTTYNFFDYSNNDNDSNNQINIKNNIDFYFNNKIDNSNNNYYINKDDFWNNENKNMNDNQRNILRNRSSSFFEERNKRKIIQNDNGNKNNFILNENINNRINNKFNNKSLSSYKSFNNRNYRYLFEYSENNNKFINKDYNNYNSNNNISLHDRYISPDYIDELKSKNFYLSLDKDEKSQYLFNSLNKIEAYFNNYKNGNNPQIKNNKNNNNSIINKTPNKINFNNKNIINKNDPKYKENLLNYILNNSELFKKIIDNALQNNKNNININKQNSSKNNNNSYNNCYLPNKSKENINKKTLLIDLDETLVHSSFKPLPINSDINFNIFYQNKPHMINVLMRPYAQEFLKKCQIYMRS